MRKTYKIMLIAFILLGAALYAQDQTVTGVVKSAQTGEALIGANIVLKGTTIGTASDALGQYELKAKQGKYTIVCSYIGYETQQYEIALTNDMVVDFTLQVYEFSLSVTVISDRAKERETPVAYTDISKQEMEFSLGSQDIPLILNSTPSVYSTVLGGGAGDARINVRGFNQRNVAIMINGVPINDMENGWVYWSNWDGLGDATSSIQVQRGLSATNLATPSIGGTMNVITDPTKAKAGVLYKNELGTGNFAKQTLFAHTGIIDDKFALSLGGVRKVGDGFVHKTWTDAWAYYLAAAYQINKSNRIELYAMGAPQRHGQRSYALNAAAFSHELARDLGFSETTLRDTRLREQGLLYNANWNGVSSAYSGQQYYEMYFNQTRQDRYDRTFLMERENYYHKPIINLNWYSQFTDKWTLYTTLYYSGGKGGGTGTFGSLRYNTSLYQRVPDWDATIASNLTHTAKFDFIGAGDSSTYVISTDARNIQYSRGGILRNSVNQQWTIGAIAKTFYKFTDNFTGSVGLDWRTAEIDHWREVRDLLGNDYFYHMGNEFDVTEVSRMKQLGDKIDYNNTNSVDWLGAYVQGEYSADRFTFYGTAGWSMIKYTFVDRFRKDAAGGELKLEPDAISGYQFKGGASFRITPEIDVYGNAGYVSKVPIFDAVINDNTSELIADPKNETFISFELGSNFYLLNRALTLKGNLYFTNWADRTITNNAYTLAGDEGIVVVTGADSRHMGIELSGAYQPASFFRFDAAFSKGIWEQTNDPMALYKNYDANIDTSFTVYLKDIKVGDAPQTQLAAGATFFPTTGLQIQLVWKWYTDFYANWDATTRIDPNDRMQSWKVPSFNLFDLHLAYNLPIRQFGADITVFAHVFNLFNTLYVADATDNSPFNAYGSFDASLGYIKPDKPHTAEAAEVFPGLPINFNAGFSIVF